jgi:hypothetical protein
MHVLPTPIADRVAVGADKPIEVETLAKVFSRYYRKTDSPSFSGSILANLKLQIC